MEKIMREVDKIKNLEDLRALNSYVVRKIKVLKHSCNVKASLKFYSGVPVKLKPECIKNKADVLYGKTGKITKMNRSKASCDFGEAGNWTIPYTMLKMVK